MYGVQHLPLVVDLLLVDRRTALIRIPDDLVLLIEIGALVSHRNDFARLRALLPADAGRVAWHPQKRGDVGNGRVEVGILL